MLIPGSLLRLESLAPHVLAETLDGGQCFRWNHGAGGTWRGVSGTVAAELRHDTHGNLLTHILAGSPEELRRLLGEDRDWHALADQLPWRSDPHLARCIAAYPGLRILRQPIGEALLGFLCSATKQILQIKQMAELLAARFGEPLPTNRAPTPGAPASDILGNGGGPDTRSGPTWVIPETPLHALPTWQRLAEVPEAELRACKLGFRARHVHAVARFLAERPGWPEETEALDYAAAKARLMELPGVGEKVADCVLLFGAGKLEAFPVDVWVTRAMARRYGLHDWRPAQVAHFGRVHFGPLAGLAQQYLFAMERREGRSRSSET